MQTRRHQATRTRTRNNDPRKFLRLLAGFPPDTFENQFARISRELRLAAALNRKEVELLCEAAFLGRLCTIAFNGLGGCGGQIKPEREANRSRLEREFMYVRNQFFTCSGWKRLAHATKDHIRQRILRVEVAEENWAW